ncbi:MAG: DUF368 domain-containing protein [Bacteroidales bacterium]|nr:DUF368 domain-containing protein [Bacteroidales bacterium]
MIRDNILVALKGFGMGAANVIPGVSGGTVALLTGIYADIVDAINSLTRPQTWKALLHGQFRAFWQYIRGPFLTALAIGVLLSVFSLAKLMTWTLAHYPVPLWAFFFGLILASAAMMFRDIPAWNVSAVLFALAGLGLGVAVCTLSPHQTPDTMWFVFLCGAISICTMILPGVSGSFILLILCKYEYIMQAVSELNWPVLAVFAAGCAAGLLAFARLLHVLLAHWEKQTMLVLLGFVLGSLVRVWPWADMETVRAAQLLRTGEAESVALQIPWALLFCLLGMGFVFVLERLGKKMDKQSS